MFQLKMSHFYATIRHCVLHSFSEQIHFNAEQYIKQTAPKAMIQYHTQELGDEIINSPLLLVFTAHVVVVMLCWVVLFDTGELLTTKFVIEEGSKG